MRRREFLAGSIALAAGKTALPSSTWAQSAPRINRIIDAHCHIFNATDLPIEGFTKKIMVPKSAQTSELVARFADYPGALEALVHAITLRRPKFESWCAHNFENIDVLASNSWTLSGRQGLPVSTR